MANVKTTSQLELMILSDLLNKNAKHLLSSAYKLWRVPAIF